MIGAPRRKSVIGLAAALAVTLLAAGCSSTSASAGSPASAASAPGGSASFGSVTEQLSWYKNVEFSGEYAAIENGYFKDAGFSEVNLTAGGPTVAPAEAALASGSAWIGRTSPLLTASANAAGSDDVLVAALYQKNPYTLTHLSTSPINSPKDLVGKTVAVPDAAIAPWNIFLAANGIDASTITRVPSTGIDSQEQLAKGVAAVLTYQQGTNLAAAGVTGYDDYRLDDHGVKIVGEALVVKRETLQNDRAKVKAFLTAWIKGWNAVLNDESTAVSLAVDKYGKDGGLDATSQTAAWKIQRESILDDDTLANGVGTITKTLVDQNITSLKLAGFDVSADRLFDTSIINEIYKEHPDLKFKSNN